MTLLGERGELAFGGSIPPGGAKKTTIFSLLCGIRNDAFIG